LTEGEVHLSLNAKTQKESKLADLKGVTLHYFQGKHPAGNVDVQIHHIDPSTRVGLDGPSTFRIWLSWVALS
jgi:Na+-transporting NADH:ubiquinone oxidoreductase subunit A